MQIVIIGSGNVATVLGRLCKKNGHEIIQVTSRDASHAKLLADELKSRFSDFTKIKNIDADLYLVAVTDTALHELKNHLHLGNKLILHTAGSVSKDVLKDISVNYGVLYPLQSLRKEMTYPAEIPFLIDGNTEEIKTLINNFAITLSSTISRATDEERLKLHLAAVIVSNFSNHLYALAEEFCQKENIEFNLLMPLINETARRAELISPALTQTGPAMRKDTFTIDKHIRLLSSHPKLKNIYQTLTNSILKD